MTNLDLLISEAIEKSDKNQYGQYVTFEMTVYNLFRSKNEEFREKIKAHLKSGNSKYVLQCYGSNLGTFYAINPYPNK